MLLSIVSDWYHKLRKLPNPLDFHLVCIPNPSMNLEGDGQPPHIAKYLK